MELTELLSGSDVLTRMDYKKLANEPQRPLLYCQRWVEGGKPGPSWTSYGERGARQDMVGVKLRLRSMTFPRT